MEVNRMGYGAMRITGKGIWGAPEDHDGAVEVLQSLPGRKLYRYGRQLWTECIGRADSSCTAPLPTRYGNSH